MVIGNEVDGVVQHRQHPEPEQIELHETGSRTIVLVPLQDASIVHTSPLDWTHLDHRPIAHDHASGVDAEMTGEVLHLRRQLQYRQRNRGVRVLCAGGDAPPPVDLFGEGVLLALGVPERLGHVADRRLGAIGDDIGDLSTVMAAVLAIDILDDLFASV